MAPPAADKVHNKRGSCLKETSQPSPWKEHRDSTAAKQSATDSADSVVKDKDEAISTTGNSHDDKRPEDMIHAEDNKNANHSDQEKLPDQARIDSDIAGAAETPKSTAVDKDQPSGAASAFSSLATGILRPKTDRKKARVRKAAAAVSSGAGRERREEARRHAELYEVCACARSYMKNVLYQPPRLPGGGRGTQSMPTNEEAVHAGLRCLVSR